MSGGYGGVDILHQCSIGVDKGEVAVVVGPNGAGKSTAMKAVFGMLELRQGRVTMDGQDISHLKPEQRVQLGMGFVPQSANVFTSMTVEENLEMGAFIRHDDISETLSQVYELFPVLREKCKQITGELSGGQQRMVEIGRTLMSEPKVLLVDEPTAGLSKMLAEEVYQMLVDLRDKEGLTILVVDQEIRQALKIADYVYVLELGKNKFEGAPGNFDNLEKAFWVG